MPSEDFWRELVVDANPRRCWDTLTDVPLLVSWVSLLEDAVVEEPMKRYRAVLSDRLGPFTLRADLDIDVSDVEIERRVRVRAAGEDRNVASRIVVDGRLELSPSGSGTRISVDGRYEVTGKVAAMGSAMIRRKANQIMADFFDNASRELR